MLFGQHGLDDDLARVDHDRQEHVTAGPDLAITLLATKRDGVRVETSQPFLGLVPVFVGSERKPLAQPVHRVACDAERQHHSPRFLRVMLRTPAVVLGYFPAFFPVAFFLARDFAAGSGVSSAARRCWIDRNTESAPVRQFE